MFIYSVYYYDDTYERMENDKGLVSAVSFEDATDKIVNKLYDNVASVAIHSLETSYDGYATLDDIEDFLNSVEIDIKEKDTSNIFN